MARKKVLTLILAGGAGGRLELLTAERAKPAMPFAGVYRLIDVPLSNAVHSGLSDVWVLQQYQPQSLSDHLANGRPWDLDRTRGGLLVLSPHTGSSGSGWHKGNADAIYRNRAVIRAFGPDLVVVLSADHVYRLDYAEVIAAHEGHGGDVTIVTTQVPLADASRFGTVEVASDGRVRGFEYKPEEPRWDTVTTEVFVYSTDALLGSLDELAEEAGLDPEADADEEQDGTSLEDFGDALLPRMVEGGRAHAFPLDGYWRDVGTVLSYWQGHQDLLTDPPALDLDDATWPILTVGIQRVPARVFGSARVDHSLISPGCTIGGTVEASVLGPGVAIEDGASVRNAVILHDTRIERGAEVDTAIVDAHATIGEGARVGQAGGDGEPEIALVGRGASVAAGEHVAADGRVPPVSREEVAARLRSAAGRR